MKIIKKLMMCIFAFVFLLCLNTVVNANTEIVSVEIDKSNFLGVQGSYSTSYRTESNECFVSDVQYVWYKTEDCNEEATDRKIGDYCYTIVTLIPKENYSFGATTVTSDSTTIIRAYPNGTEYNVVVKELVDEGKTILNKVKLDLTYQVAVNNSLGRANSKEPDIYSANDQHWYDSEDCSNEYPGKVEKDKNYYLKLTIYVEDQGNYIFSNNMSFEIYYDNELVTLKSSKVIDCNSNSNYMYDYLLEFNVDKNKIKFGKITTAPDYMYWMNLMRYGYSSSMSGSPINGHLGWYSYKVETNSQFDDYDLFEYDGENALTNVKPDRLLSDDEVNEKCYTVKHDDGTFDVYFVYNLAPKTLIGTMSPLTGGTKLTDIRYTLTSGSKKTPTWEVYNGNTFEAMVGDTLERDKTYKVKIPFSVSIAHEVSEITFNEELLKLDENDFEETNVNELTITYTFLCTGGVDPTPAPSSGSSKKYKADDKDTAEKIAGSGKKGSTRTITPIEGKKVANVKVTDKDGNEIEVTMNEDGTYSFTQPACNVNVEVTYKNREIKLTIGSNVASVDDEKSNLDVCPVIRNDRTMLPIRFIAENLGAKVLWDEKNPNEVIITRGDTKIEITLGKNKAKVNGKEYELDSIAFSENDRTYLPVRFVSEALNAKVLWDESKPNDVTIIEQ